MNKIVDTQNELFKYEVSKRWVCEMQMIVVITTEQPIDLETATELAVSVAPQSCEILTQRPGPDNWAKCYTGCPPQSRAPGPRDAWAILMRSCG
jgi:hypothetical protein